MKSATLCSDDLDSALDCNANFSRLMHVPLFSVKYFKDERRKSDHMLHELESNSNFLQKIHLFDSIEEITPQNVKIAEGASQIIGKVDRSFPECTPPFVCETYSSLYQRYLKLCITIH